MLNYGKVEVKLILKWSIEFMYCVSPVQTELWDNEVWTEVVCKRVNNEVIMKSTLITVK